jgi:hypothetical protein
MYLFTGHLPAQARIRLDPAELSAWTWVTPSEIPHLLPPARSRAAQYGSEINHSH